MKPTVLVVAVLAAIGCNRTESNSDQMTASDNTARNERDREPGALTPTDQAENATDRTITQQIRQEVMKGDDISTDGKNVKIITLDGVVTLRGPVQNAQEKQQIVQAAQHVDGVKRVDNQLEIAAK